MPAEIKRLALEEFLRQAQAIHTIAFLQWRLRYPSNFARNHGLLIELINERMAHLYVSVSEKIPSTMIYPNKKYIVSDKYLKKYQKAI